jgi:hypothetical protein
MAYEYRIATNGFKYRIESKRFTFWTSRLVWKPLGANGGFPAPAYKTLEDARDALQRLRAGENEHRSGWRPIE